MERPPDYYSAFIKQSTITQETKRFQLFWRVHGVELTPLSRVLLHKLTVPQLVNKFSTFLQPEDSLPNSQQPSTCPCAEQGYFMSRPAIQFLKSHFYIIIPSTPRFFHVVSFLQVFPPNCCMHCGFAAVIPGDLNISNIS